MKYLITFAAGVLVGLFTAGVALAAGIVTAPDPVKFTTRTPLEPDHPDI